MKTFTTNFQKLAQIADTIAEYDELSALSFICLLIDQTARQSANTAPELADIIAEQVKAVNAALGAY